ncbi:zinc finger, GRF-type containing protein, partial [Tanacetum coccineum]
MVRCNKCDSIGVIRTSWTPGNPGRRFYCCSKRGSNHGFIDWCDEETCQCSVLIIKQLEDEVAEIRAKKGRMKMMLIFTTFFIGDSLLAVFFVNLGVTNGVVGLREGADGLAVTKGAVGLRNGAVFITEGLVGINDGVGLTNVCDWLAVGAEGLT